MDYRNLGRTGMKVSELCMGTMQFGWTAVEDLSYQILDTAYAAGINFLDTADVYSRWVPGNPGGVAETIIGNWIKRSQIPRDKLIIATKVRGRMGDGPNDEGLSRGHILSAVEASLRRLNTEYIDLYQTHSPDEATPIEETIRALDDLVRQGKVRYIGCSNYKAWQLVEALWVSEGNHLSRYDSLQPHYNMVHRAEFERELADVCRNYQVGVIPYSPLAAGFLTGKYRRGEEVDSVRVGSVKRYFIDRNWELLERMELLGKEHLVDGKPANAGQVALAWLLADPLITSPIIGPRTVEQLADNLGAVAFRLNSVERGVLDEASDWRKD